MPKCGGLTEEISESFFCDVRGVGKGKGNFFPGTQKKTTLTVAVFLFLYLY